MEVTPTREVGNLHSQSPGAPVNQMELVLVYGWDLSTIRTVSMTFGVPVRHTLEPFVNIEATQVIMEDSYVTYGTLTIVHQVAIVRYNS